MTDETKRNLKFRTMLMVIAALLVVVVLTGYIFETTLSKYRSGIKGYTDMTPAEFHAMFLGAETSASLTEKWSQGSSAALFGEEISIEILQPGGPAEIIPFSLVNATSPDKISGVDIEYNLSVRTTGNIPLQFTLTRVVSSANVAPTAVNSDGLETFKTGSSCVVEAESLTDAAKYTYAFYRVHSAGLDDECLEDEPFMFVLEGGKLSLDEFSLIIEWPVIHEAGKKNTDDASYMKEVDIIELVADLVSADRRKDYIGSGAIGSGAVNSGSILPVPIIHDDHGAGLLIVYPGADYSAREASQWGNEYDYTYRYKLPHYAFGPTDYVIYSTGIGEISSTSVAAVDAELPNAISKSTTSSAYEIKVTNGNGLYDGVGNLVAVHDTEVVNLKAKIYIPLTKDTIDSAGILRTKVSVLAKFPDGSVRLATISQFDSKRASTLDIETGQFTDYGTNKLQQIGELVNSSAYNVETQRNRFYFEYEFGMIIDGTMNELGVGTVKNYYYYYNYQLQNFNEDGTTKQDYISFLILTDSSPEQMADLAAYNDFYVDITAMYPHES